MPAQRREQNRAVSYPQKDAKFNLRHLEALKLQAKFRTLVSVVVTDNLNITVGVENFRLCSIRVEFWRELHVFAKFCKNYLLGNVDKWGTIALLIANCIS